MMLLLDNAAFDAVFVVAAAAVRRGVGCKSGCWTHGRMSIGVIST